MYHPSERWKAIERAAVPEPAMSSDPYASRTIGDFTKLKPAGERMYAGPTPFGASLASLAIEMLVAEEIAPEGISKVNRPSADRIDPPCGPIVAEDAMSTGKGMIGVTTGSPEALSMEESKTSTLPEVTRTRSVASSGIGVPGKRSS